MIDVYRLLTRWWTAFALAASLAMLGAAHAFERFGGLEPCNLCLKQREVYWGAVVVAVLGFNAVAEFASRGVELLNGPVDRPWGVRTAAFADPAGHIWELAGDPVG